MFFNITGAIYIGGAGAVIIGGLYWKRGTTPAAWAAMITGSTLAVTGVIIKQKNPDFRLTGQEMAFIAMISATTVYVLVSLLGPKTVANMDRLLHRGAYAPEDEKNNSTIQPTTGWRSLLPAKDYTLSDKIIYYVVIWGWPLVWFIIFAIITCYNLFFDLSYDWWMRFWKYYILFLFCMSILVAFWLTIGGLKDLKAMFRTLSTKMRDSSDDGMVRARKKTK